MDELIVLNATFGEEAECDAACTALVEQRLAACAQKVAITSTYRWQGAVEHGDEWLLTAKTRAGLFARAAEAIRAAHSYDLPEIVATRLSHVTDAYRAWVLENTEG